MRQTDGQKNCDTINARKANRKLETNPIGKVVEEGTGGGVGGGLEEGVDIKAMGVSLETSLDTHKVWEMSHVLHHKMDGLSDQCTL